MLRKIQTLFLIIIVLTSIVSIARADGVSGWWGSLDPILMKPYWQLNDYNILGCQDNDSACQQARSTHTMSQYGCAVTSISMLYWAYGFYWIPDVNNQPSYNMVDHLDQDKFNNYLAATNGLGSTRGFFPNYDMDWVKTTNNVFYYSPFG